MTDAAASRSRASAQARTPQGAPPGAPPRAPFKEGPLLPPSPRADRPLMFVIAVIVALACVAAIAARAAWSAADAWTADLAGVRTVEVRPQGDESAEAAAARAAATLGAVEGVTSARALTRAEIDALLAPWFGAGGAPAGAPLPGLVDVRLDRVAPARANDLLVALDALGMDGEVDEHDRWTDDIRRAAGAARALALVAFLALLAAAAAVTSFATRASFAARSDVVDVLHVVGAADSFIARAFTGRFLQLGLRAGLVGAALAGAAGLAAVLLTQGIGEELVPRFRFARVDIVILALAPLASAAVAALTARETVRAALTRMY
jgi:cell division transport system permease protein